MTGGWVKKNLTCISHCYANGVKDDKKIIEIAKKRFKLAEEAEMKMRKESLEDLRFRAGKQWPDQIKTERDMDRRPCLTVNRLPQFIRQVTNDQRQNRPAIKVSPVDDLGDSDTAKIYQGIIRHIEYNSNADVAIDTAFEAAATQGFGYFRVLTEYADEMSFDQEIKIKRIRNAFSVYVDPSYQEPDGSDMEWGFIFEDMPREDYIAKYGESDLASMSDWSSIGDKSAGWLSDNSVRVAEYFCKEYKECEIVLFEDPEGNREVLEKEKFEAINAEGLLEIIETRKTQKPIIKWYKINAVETLDESEWLGKWIPIIPVLGDELDVDGERILEGIVRHAKDPQKMYNYWASSETETIALAPKAPFIGVEGQFEGYEEQWRTANTRNYAFLQYKNKSLNGQPAPPPSRNSYEPPIQAITMARMQSSDDLKSTTGIYDASLGNKSNENSGIAISRRAFQSQTANFHYVDNLSRALRHLGRILIDLIPKVYDGPRSMRIIGEDDQEKVVMINQIFKEGGKEKQYDLGHGRYDVTVASGPSYATKREEALDSMLALTQKYPKVAEVAGDLMVKNMDWPGAQEIAERLKKTIPPEILESESDKEIPAAVKAKMDQMSQMVEVLTQQLNDKTEYIEQETAKYEFEKHKAQLDFNAKLAKIEGDMRTALLKESGLDNRAAFEAEINQLNQAQNQNLNSNGSGPVEKPVTLEDFNLFSGDELSAGESEV